jgi:hypothetical protein
MKSKPTWADVKTKLAGFDRASLVGVLRDLYAADEGNRAFLHARFGLGKTHCSRIRTPLTDRCGRMSSGDNKRLFPKPRGDSQI